MWGSTSYCTLMSRSASRACSSVAAATAAISSPWNIASFPGSMTVIAAFTPGAFCAAVRSTETTRACGYGDRRMRPCSMPGRLMSYGYFAAPVALTGPSTRRIRVPMSVGCSGQGYFSFFAGWAGVLTSGTCSATSHPLRRQHCLEHTCIGAAAADVARQPCLRLLGCGLRVLLEQRHRGDHEARRAEAAHETVGLAERLLHRVQHGAFGEALDRANRASLHLDGQMGARVDCASVRNDGAGPAGSAIADAFHAGDVEAIAHRVEQRHAR